MTLLKKLFLSLTLVVSAVSVLSFSTPTTVLAQSRVKDVCTTASCPIGNPSTLQGRDGIFNTIIQIAEFILYILGAVAVLFIVYGGVLFVTDTGDGKRAENGKKILFNAIIGLVIAIASFFIVQVVSNIAGGRLLA